MMLNGVLGRLAAVLTQVRGIIHANRTMAFVCHHVALETNVETQQSAIGDTITPILNVYENHNLVWFNVFFLLLYSWSAVHKYSF